LRELRCSKAIANSIDSGGAETNRCATHGDCFDHRVTAAPSDKGALLELWRSVENFDES
jgi:hypothetical protein